MNYTFTFCHSVSVLLDILHYSLHFFAFHHRCLFAALNKIITLNTTFLPGSVNNITFLKGAHLNVEQTVLKQH